MIHYWPFSNSNYDDVIGNANPINGVSYSFVQDRHGNANSAIFINDGYLTLPNLIYFSGDYSATVWVNIQANKNWFRIFDIGNGAGVDNVLLGFSQYSLLLATKVHLGISTIGIKKVTTPIIINKWYFIAVTLQGTNVKLYIDGVELLSDQSLIPNEIIRGGYIGRSIWTDYGANDQNANAYYDDLKIFNRALSFGEISQLYITP